MELDSLNAKLIRDIWLSFKKNSDNLFKDFDLTFSQTKLLLYLNEMENHKCEFKKMEKFLNIAQSTNVCLINKLEEKGYVTCFVDSDDKRVKVMQLTNKGLDICNQTKLLINSAEIGMFKELTIEEKEQLFNLLSMIKNSQN